MSDPGDGHLRLEGAFNFRPVGAYAAAGGRTVRSGRLWRSDGLHRLSQADLGQLAGLGLRTVIDLRTPAELEQRGAPEWAEPAPQVHHLPLMDVLPHSDEYAESWTRPDHVANQYLSILEAGRPALVGALSLLADPASYPAVVHCMAGKDRTGIVVATVLGMVGVGADDIVADYALSAAGMRRLLERLTAERPEQAAQLAAGAAAMVGAHPETMRSFVTAVMGRYGSWDGLALALGHPDLPERLVAALLTEG